MTGGGPPHQVLTYLHSRDGGGRPLVLLLLRRPERFGIWQGVTGRVERGEAPEEAARREIFEETGWSVGAALGSLGPPREFSLPAAFRGYYPGHSRITEFAFHAPTSRGAPRLRAEEHLRHRWCSFSEARDLLFWEANRRSLDRLEQVLDRQGSCAPGSSPKEPSRDRSRE